MNELPATYKTALKLWWAQTWRMWLFLIIGIIPLMILPIILQLLGLSQLVGATLGGVVGLSMGVFIFMFVIRRLMIKGFGRKYRLAIVEKENA